MDTIAAIATPAGRGGIGIIRVSGPIAFTIAQQLSGKSARPRYAEFCHFKDEDGRVIDTGLVLYFPAPQSFTGEEVVEFQGHGGTVVLAMLLSAILKAGARQAHPGEFSQRAFLNDKLDLVQAEAIADLIDSQSVQAARSANRSLHGEFSGQVNMLLQQLIDIRVYIESAIDFSDEEIEFLQGGQIENKLKAICSTLQALQDSANQGRLLNEGVKVVLAGPPNAGKSSLLNALAKNDTAIVSEVPGTTRDVIRENILLDGLPIQFVDTAGLRSSEDPVEQMGIARARTEISAADYILVVVDDSVDNTAFLQSFADDLPAHTEFTIVNNKIDLSGKQPHFIDGPQRCELFVSMKSNAGMASLIAHIKQRVGFVPGEDNTFTARQRHLELLKVAHQSVDAGLDQLQQHQATELLAEELRHAQDALSQITGQFTNEDLLGEIFSSFCIGK